jgi:hypothetical protein
MSILQGRLTVVVTTIIASGMIVITGNGVAEDKTEAVVGNTVSTKQSDGMPKKLTTTEKQTGEILSKPSVSVVNNIPLAPPPGPFISEGAVISTQKSLLAPIAPKEPINLSKEPEQRANSLYFKTAPSLSQKVVEPKSDLSEPLPSTRPAIAPRLSQSASQIGQRMEQASSSDQAPKQAMMPKLKAIVPSAPTAPKNTVQQPKMNPVDVPIWVHRGDVTRQAPTNPSSKSISQQSQPVMPLANMHWNNNEPAQQYIYVPVPMMPSNIRPPQMPVFNGNFIPPSNYWGNHMQPNYAPNVIIKKESIGSKSVPTQKGNKE